MAFAHIRHGTKDNGGTSATTVFVTMAATVGVGNLLVVSIGWASQAGDTVTQVTDDKGNSYTLVDVVRSSATTYSWQTAYLAGITNAPITITATLSTSRPLAAMLVGEYSGGASGSAIDGHAAQVIATAVTSTNGITSGTFTTVTDNDLIYGSVTDVNNGVSMAAGTSFTIRVNNFNSTWYSEDRTLATAGSVAGTFTNSSAQSPYLVAGLAMKPFAVSGIANKFLAPTRQALVRASYW